MSDPVGQRTPARPSLASQSSDRVCAFNRLSTDGLALQGRRGVTASESRLLGSKVENDVRIAIVVDVLQGETSRRSLRSGLPKRTVPVLTLVALKTDVARMATGITPLLRRLTLFGSLPGLMSMSTGNTVGVRTM